MKERRAIRRRHLMFYLRVFDAGTGASLGNLVDISPAGLMVTGEKQLTPGARHHLHMRLPVEIIEQSDIEFQATVVRSSDDLSPGLYDTGFRDLEMSPDHRARLEALIDEYGLRDRA